MVERWIGLVLLVVSVSSLFLTLYIALQRRTKGSYELAVMMAAASVYALGYALEIQSTDIPGMIRWVRVEYLGIPFIPYFWMLFAISFSWSRPISRPLAIALGIIPVMTAAIMWFPQSRPLIYAGNHLRLDGPFPTLGIERGPWYWVNAAYFTIALPVGFIALVLHARRVSPARRRNARLAAVTAALPLLNFGVYLAGFTPWGLDSGPFGLLPVGIMFSLILFRFGLGELAPVARAAVFESMRDGVLVLDHHGSIESANAEARRILALNDLSIGQPAGDALGGLAGLLGLVRAGEGSVRIDLPEPESGSASRFDADAAGVFDSRRRRIGTVVTLRDVTQVQDLLARLRDLATTDELTGLDNRRKFFEDAGRELELARRAGRTLSAFIVDLDHFKHVNDRYGHVAGDRVLRDAAFRMRGVLRKTDFLCRYGGEEFAAVLPDTDAAGLLALAERLRAAVSEAPVTFGQIDIPITASVGVSTLPAGGACSLESLLDVADKALYLAKKAGRNRVSPLLACG